MVVLEAPTLADVVGVKDAPCPRCDGEGVERTNVTRNRDGVWECDEHECSWCQGLGVIELTRCHGLECDEWFDPQVNGCQHGQPLCDDHRPECGECMTDAREDAATDPWGGAA
jgi:hypothetical protein